MKLRIKIVLFLCLAWAAATVSAQNRGSAETIRQGWTDSLLPGLVPYSSYTPYDSTQILRKDPYTIFVNFPLDHVELDFGFHDNTPALDRIMQSVKSVTDNPAMVVKCIQIVGMASFEGSAEYNYKLGLQRAVNLREYIKQHAPMLTDDVFELYSAGEAWTEFRSQIEDMELIYSMQKVWTNTTRLM